MLKTYLPGKTRLLDFVYLEPGRAECLQCRWKRGAWEFSAPVHVSAQGQESIFTALRLASPLGHDGKDRRDAGLVAILAKPFYAFSRRFYPAHLGSELKKAIAFDWDENLPWPLEGQLRRHGRPVRHEDLWLVPFQSLPEGTHDAVGEALDADSYGFFLTLPSHAAFGLLFRDILEQRQEGQGPEFVLAPLAGEDGKDGESAEIYRLSGAQVTDLFELNPGRCVTSLLGTVLSSFCNSQDREAAGAAAPALAVLEYPKSPPAPQALDHEGVQHAPLSLGEPLVQALARSILDFGSISGFNGYKRLLPAGKRLYSLAMGLAVLLLLGGAAGAIFLERGMQERLAAMDARVEAVKKEYAAMNQHVSRDRAFEQQIELLRGIVTEALPPVRTLNLLSRITPRHTWITRLDYGEGRLMLVCVGDDALEYRDILSKTPGLEDVELSSSVKRREGKEHYSISMRLVPGKLEEPEPDPPAPGAPGEGEIPPEVLQALPEASPEPGPETDEEAGPEAAAEAGAQEAPAEGAPPGPASGSRPETHAGPGAGSGAGSGVEGIPDLQGPDAAPLPPAAGDGRRPGPAPESGMPPAPGTVPDPGAIPGPAESSGPGPDSGAAPGPPPPPPSS